MTADVHSIAIYLHSKAADSRLCLKWFVVSVGNPWIPKPSRSVGSHGNVLKTTKNIRFLFVRRGEAVNLETAVGHSEDVSQRDSFKALVLEMPARGQSGWLRVLLRILDL